MKKTIQPGEALWTVRDVMARLNIQRTCATEIIKSLPHITLGRSLRVERLQVEEYIRQHYVMPGSTTVLVKPKKKKTTAPLPGFDENGKLLRRRNPA